MFQLLIHKTPCFHLQFQEIKCDMPGPEERETHTGMINSALQQGQQVQHAEPETVQQQVNSGPWRMRLV